MKNKILPTFSLVYQGGHHDVYCNGERHYSTKGGYAGKHDIEEDIKEADVEYLYRCNCEEFK